MNSLSLLTGLHKYMALLNKFMDSIEGVQAHDCIRSVSLNNNTIQLKAEQVKANQKQSGVYRIVQPYLDCIFKIDKGHVTLTSIHCTNLKDQEAFKVFIENDPNAFVWQTQEQNIYNSEIIHYLSIADSIAKESFLCALGDDYKTGYYSEVRLQHDLIFLRQSNRYNSRSIDHKNDYHLRELEFFIPLEHSIADLPKRKDTIGKMQISFFDHSSENNRLCGTRIKEMIKAERALFEANAIR